MIRAFCKSFCITFSATMILLTGYWLGKDSNKGKKGKEGKDAKQED